MWINAREQDLNSLKQQTKVGQEDSQELAMDDQKWLNKDTCEQKQCLEINYSDIICAL